MFHMGKIINISLMLMHFNLLHYFLLLKFINICKKTKPIAKFKKFFK